MDRDLSHAFPPLATKALAIKMAYESLYPSKELRIIGVWRSMAEQQMEYAKGRTSPGPGVTTARSLGRVVTECDGVIVKSMHQGINPAGYPCSFAIDFGVFLNGIYATAEVHYKPLQELAHHQGLKSGWDFVGLGGKQNDPPHVEIMDIRDIDWSLFLTYPTSDSTAVIS